MPGCPAARSSADCPPRPPMLGPVIRTGSISLISGRELREKEERKE